MTITSPTIVFIPCLLLMAIGQSCASVDREKVFLISPANSTWRDVPLGPGADDIQYVVYYAANESGGVVEVLCVKYGSDGISIEVHRRTLDLTFYERHAQWLKWESRSESSH